MLIVNQTGNRMFNIDNILSICMKQRGTIYEIICETESTECVLARYNTKEDIEESYKRFLKSYRATEIYKHAQASDIQSGIIERAEEKQIDLHVHFFN